MSNKFNCNKCDIEFSLGDGGFIGSLGDYEVEKLSTKDKHLRQKLREIECYPFLEFVELCKDCYVSNKFNCDECEIEFSLGDGGFVGSLGDYEDETLSTEDKNLRKRLREIGFYPLLSLFELCKDCYLKKDKN